MTASTLDEYLDHLKDGQIEELADKIATCYHRSERWRWLTCYRPPTRKDGAIYRWWVLLRRGNES